MLVAVAQIEPRLGEREHNCELCLESIEDAARAGCSLVVLPECASSGYVFESPEEARGHAEEIPGSFVHALESACSRLDITCVAGMLEREGDVLRNTAVIVGPDGLAGRYRKSHLPFLGVDRFVVPGDELTVVETPLGRIGVEICYDLRFPEVTRALALEGAEIIVLPTNWPLAAAANAELLTTARAYENCVYLLVANRVGRERTAEFCGRSQIVDPAGLRIAETDATTKTVLIGEADVERARDKSIVPDPGEYEMHLFDHRRPELYAALVEERQAFTTR